MVESEPACCVRQPLNELNGNRRMSPNHAKKASAEPEVLENCNVAGGGQNFSASRRPFGQSRHLPSEEPESGARLVCRLSRVAEQLEVRGPRGMKRFVARGTWRQSKLGLQLQLQLRVENGSAVAVFKKQSKDEQQQEHVLEQTATGLPLVLLLGLLGWKHMP
ncbi:hypothetical protein AXG93_3545s1230 [Marchantia polymorpha subsp. ruderalis]|uniref:Uncharacterized protein n=1 Tax=Marchantia polymorpha subsp. ruderalis TaxID=1480154 RepID=A0A176VW30_MARPO|nr:hypothetical protein AXG93_3545s1230 [Marchantia polymorpha subsp. ruderalis]